MLAKRRKKNYWGFSVNCTGNEADLSDCKLGKEIQLKGNNTCRRGMPAVVSCVPGRAFAPSVSMGFRKAYRVEVGLTTNTVAQLAVHSTADLNLLTFCYHHIPHLVFIEILCDNCANISTLFI